MYMCGVISESLRSGGLSGLQGTVAKVRSDAETLTKFICCDFFFGGPVLQTLVFSLIRSSSLFGSCHRLASEEADSEMSIIVPRHSLGTALGIHNQGRAGERRETGLGRGRTCIAL